MEDRLTSETCCLLFSGQSLFLQGASALRGSFAAAHWQRWIARDCLIFNAYYIWSTFQLILARSVFKFKYNSGVAGWSPLSSVDRRCHKANGMIVPEVAKAYKFAWHTLSAMSGVQPGGAAAFFPSRKGMLGAELYPEVVNTACSYVYEEGNLIKERSLLTLMNGIT